MLSTAADPQQLTVPRLPIPDPFAGLGDYLVGHVTDAVAGLLRAVSDDFLGQLAAPVARYVLHTPDLAGERTLVHYWTVSLAVLGACLGLLLAIAATALITGPTGRLGLAAREALGVRLVGGVAAAAVSLPVVALEVGLANRVVDAFVGTGFAAGHDPLWQALRHGDAGAGLAAVITVTVGVVLLIALVLGALARWATLWLLVVLAPLAMGLAVLPGGQGLARLWWRLQAATVLLPIANAVLLGTYVAMFSSARTGLLGALAGVAVLGLMTKLPGWAAGAALHTTGAEISGRLHRAHRTAASLAPRLTGARGPVRGR